MLATPKDLSSQVGHILVLPLESVSRFERTGFLRAKDRANEELGSRLSVVAAGRAFRGLDECVETTFQVPSHNEGKVGAVTFRVVTDTFFGKNGDPRYLRGSPCERRGRSRRNNSDKCHYRQSSERQDSQSSFHDSYVLLSEYFVVFLGKFAATRTQSPWRQDYAHPGLHLPPPSSRFPRRVDTRVSTLLWIMLRRIGTLVRQIT